MIPTAVITILLLIGGGATLPQNVIRPESYAIPHMDDTRQAVFAVAPKEDGLLAMAIAGKGSGPQQPADRYETRKD